MSSVEKFEDEIAAIVLEWDIEKKDLVPSFITHALIQRHKNGLARTNEHTPFLEHYTYKGLRQHVGVYIAKNYPDDHGGDDNKADQHILPGFDYVQKRYVVRRGEEDVAVLVELMTDTELDAKIQLLRRRGKACLAHADELDRYKHLRGPQTKSA